MKNFPKFVVIHTVKGFGIVNKAEIDVFFWNSLAFLMILATLKSNNFQNNIILALNKCTDQ